MPVTTHTTINGVIVHEDRAGTQRNYRPDTLGNTLALTDATTATDTMTYWPYGEIRTRTGTNATRFLFVGALGYSNDGGYGLNYVRARYYQASRGRWATVDPLWPIEKTFSYVELKPQELADPSGWLAVTAKMCSGDCAKLKGATGGCMALMCAMSASKGFFDYLQKLFDLLNRFGDWDKFKDFYDWCKGLKKKLQQKDPFTNAEACCKKAGAFGGKLKDARSIEDLIALICRQLSNDGKHPGYECRLKYPDNDDECAACCDRERTGAANTWCHNWCGR